MENQPFVWYGCYLPKLGDIVSRENPIPWSEWLPEQCEIRAEGNGVTFYGVVNCNYLVCDGQVFRNYGFHGRVLFNLLQTQDGKEQVAEQLRKVNQMIRDIRKAQELVEVGHI